MRVYVTRGGYFYKELKNGNKNRISKEQYQKLYKTIKKKKLTGGVNAAILKQVIYTSIYGVGESRTFGARPQITNESKINKQCERLILFYSAGIQRGRSNPFNKKVMGSTDKRFTNMTFYEAIEKATKLVFLKNLVTEGIINQDQIKVIQARATNVLTTFEKIKKEWELEQTEIKKQHAKLTEERKVQVQRDELGKMAMHMGAQAKVRYNKLQMVIKNIRENPQKFIKCDKCSNGKVSIGKSEGYHEADDGGGTEIFTECTKCEGTGFINKNMIKRTQQAKQRLAFAKGLQRTSNMNNLPINLVESIGTLI